MSARLLLFSAALGFLAACSDTTGPSDLAVKPLPINPPTAQPNGPAKQPIGPGNPTPPQ